MAGLAVAEARSTPKNPHGAGTPIPATRGRVAPCGTPSVPYYQDEAVTIYHGDCREILPTLGGVGLVVTDPPYTFGLASTDSEGKAGGWGDLMNNALFYGAWLSECRKLTNARQGACWVFNSWRSFPVLARAAFEISWSITSLLVWDKQWIGPGGSRGLRPAYELVALFCHDDFQLLDRGLPDIWPSQWASQRPNGHAAEKPVDLLGKIIRESGGAGRDGAVLDPFMGSGSTLVAARREGRRSIGIEIEEKWCEVAANRCAQSALELPSTDGTETGQGRAKQPEEVGLTREASALRVAPPGPVSTEAA